MLIKVKLSEPGYQRWGWENRKKSDLIFDMLDFFWDFPTDYLVGNWYIAKVRNR